MDAFRTAFRARGCTKFNRQGAHGGFGLDRAGYSAQYARMPIRICSAGPSWGNVAANALAGAA